MFDSLQPHKLYSSWNSPGQNTGVSSLSLLQGIFPTQGSSPGHPHYRWILYQLSHKGSLRTLDWVAYLFSSGSSQPRDQTTLQVDSYQLSHRVSPRILEWVNYLFSSGSSWPRKWTGISWIAGGFFTNWAKREDLNQSVNQSWGLDNCFMATVLLIYTSRVILLIPPPPHTSCAQPEWIWPILLYFFLPLLCSV